MYAVRIYLSVNRSVGSDLSWSYAEDPGCLIILLIFVVAVELSVFPSELGTCDRCVVVTCANVASRCLTLGLAKEASTD